ncbi:ketoacyl-ACP synthase III family protein [Micromonospora sp. WMMD882]|uniref:ketoacyl-ACP synthase III family protein n=1 Tax=Micromonospora sp. WMMD882 TaxID=3015151 RepID=UPI00248C6068|nr:ketoacyl-ACP synthase III family protein [Micromonospora sp. WMMD882]WBB80517.1 ketoacyl-ACP synthase III family protein [Micromonospora sp. WMMD882]
MRWTDLYLNAASVVVERQVTVAEAVAAGWYDAAEADRTRQRAVAVADSSGPDLGVAAGRAALRASGLPPADVGLVIHASCYFQGVEFWNAGAYVQHHVLGHGDATAFELRQMSNGGMCALDVAAGQLAARPTLGAALLTTGDRFCEPGFPRWRTDRGLVFGDAGTAVVLSRRPGPLRLVATASYAAPELEGLHRAPFAAGFHQAGPVDLLDRKRRFLETMPVNEVTARNEAGMLTAIKRCLEDAEASIDDMATVVAPFFGADLSAKQCLRPIGLRAEQTLLEWGLDIGHLGSGDQFAGLAHLLDSDALTAGRRVLLVGVGAGFTWTCAVVEKE